MNEGPRENIASRHSTYQDMVQAFHSLYGRRWIQNEGSPSDKPELWYQIAFINQELEARESLDWIRLDERLASNKSLP